MGHIVLLGDSIFDNAAYVPPKQEVIEHVRKFLPERWIASLLAVDGKTSMNAAEQLLRLPKDCSHLVLSVGGNDAIGTLSKLDASVSTIKQALSRLNQIRLEFESSYESLVLRLMSLDRPLLVCTIYDHVPALPNELKTALGIFNDVIIRVAIKHQLSILDLRMTCQEFTDFSVISPIEPSATGGKKIAKQLVAAICNRSMTPECKVFR